MEKIILCEESDEPPSTSSIFSNQEEVTQTTINIIPPSTKPAILFTPKSNGNGSLSKNRPKFVVSRQTRQFRKRFFPAATDSEWNDWRWQLRNRIKTLKELERIVNLSGDERDAITRHNGPLPVGINPYYATLLDTNDPMQPLRRTVIM